MSNILVVGSLAYDTVQTPAGKVDGALGGSANYFGVAASLFVPVRIVGVVGEDYKDDDTALLRNRGVDISGIERLPGKTFHWAGEYGRDLNEAKTLRTELNVFADFHPKLPPAFTKSEYIFLANIDPVLQQEVLTQIQNPKVVAADTMNFWIQSKVEELLKVLKNLDIILINEGEVKLLTETSNIVAAARKLSTLGPKHVVIKRGEYGVLMFSGGHFFSLPAFPVDDVVDPTGAGDTFAGGVMGYLAKKNADLSIENLKMAVVYGTLLASFTVQDFSLGAIKDLKIDQVAARFSEFRKIVNFPS